jgi:hypothetical protein
MANSLGRNQSFSKIVWRYNLDYDDTIASLPIGTSSSLWGCHQLIKVVIKKNTKKRYGYSGNSFVCAVEFGDKIKLSLYLGNRRS